MVLEIVAEERVGFWSCGFATDSHSIPTALFLFGIKIFIVKMCEVKIVKALRNLDNRHVVADGFIQEKQVSCQ